MVSADTLTPADITPETLAAIPDEGTAASVAARLTSDDITKLLTKHAFRGDLVWLPASPDDWSANVVARLARDLLQAQAAEIARLTAKLDACILVKDRAFACATKAEAALADQIKEDEAWSGDVVQAVLDLVGIDDPDPDGYYASDLKSMLDDYDAAFTDVTALAEMLASEMARARDVMSIFIDEHSDPGADAMSSHHCMSALIRKAVAAGLLARAPATLTDRIPAKHTPGGWSRNIPPARKYATIFAGRNTHVCVLSVKGVSDEEIEANANLIAAAPDLLESLQAAAHLLRSAGFTMEGTITQTINRAILRACGGAL